jgi:hypothetical protein
VGAFWTNTIWFILLGTTTIIEIVYILAKTENRGVMFALFLTISGMVFLFEIVLFGFLKSYDYYPMIFQHISRLDDGLAGNVFSQFSVGATALLVSVFNLKYYWYGIIALMYGGIEETFLRLGVYSHNWYRTWMTVVGLTVLFIIVRILYTKTVRGMGPVLKYINVFFATFAPYAIIAAWPFKLLGYTPFTERLVQDQVESAMILLAVNYLTLSNVIMLGYYLKLRWWWHVVIILILYTAYYAAYTLKYITYDSIGMLALFSTVQILGVYLSIFVMDRLYDVDGKFASPTFG